MKNMTSDIRHQTSDGFGLYIHIPFCKQKCFYCDFNSYAGLDRLHSKYVDALIMEMEKFCQDGEVRKVSSIYFGGGTPTTLEEALFEKILKSCHKCFEIDDSCEITIEANPETLTFAQLKNLRNLGINRLSLGFQSLDTRLLPVLGRRHTAQKALQSFDLAKLAGFKNINLDLMYGIPGQDIISWDSTLKNALRLKPQHISIYALTLDPNTHIARRITKKELPPVNDDLQAELFNYACEVLRICDYTHYEISNFTRPGYECHHNILYWKNGNYLGLGAGAHSHFTDIRYSNVKAPKIYIEKISMKGSARDKEEKLTGKQILSETVFLGLRMMEGIDLRSLDQQFNLSFSELYASEIEELKSSGLVEGQEQLKLTPKGVLLSNEVFSKFV